MGALGFATAGEHIVVTAGADHIAPRHTTTPFLDVVAQALGVGKFTVVETGGTEYEQYRDSNHWADWGKIQYERKGCNSCHSVDGSTSKGPSWKGIFNKMEDMTTGPAIKVDEAYLRESMMIPQAHVVKGFEPIMPTFQGLLRDHEIKGLIEYIKTLQN